MAAGRAFPLGFAASLNAQPSTLNAQPSTLNAQPSTLNHKRSALPLRSTLNAQP